MGLIPNLPPKKFETSAEPTDIILSLVGTTSLGFNLFLGGSMAVGKELEPTQRGIAFSTISALEVSVLILIVGAGTAEETTGGFSIQALSNLIESLIDQVGVYVFAIGFIAAALSSMLAVPLGAALTAESVFSQCREELEEKEEEELEERVDSRARVSHPSTSSHRVIRAAKSLTMKPLLLVPHAQRLTRDNGLNISSTIFINRYHNQQ